jgi:hydrogenase/urease accessory protein HupE
MLCAAVLCVAITPLTGHSHEARPAYLEIKQTGADRYQVVWKVPTTGGVRVRIQPAFPAHCYLASEPEVEELPAALVERYELGCGPQGLDGEMIEVLGLRKTLIEVVVRVEMLDGRKYQGSLRAAAPKYTIAPRESRPSIAGQFVMLGMRHAVRRLSAVLLAFALAWTVGLRRRLATLLALFALGYTAGFVGAAQGLIDIATEWGTMALAATAFLLAVRSLERTGEDSTPASLKVWLPVAGIIYGAAFGQDWIPEGIARVDVPVAATALSAGIWAGLLLVAALAGLGGRVASDLGLSRVIRARLMPFYALGAMSVLLFALALSNIAAAPVVQPYLRPESMLLAVAAGLLLGLNRRLRPGIGLVFLMAMQVAGLVMVVRGVALPLASLAIPLSLSVLGIMLMFGGRLPGFLTLGLAGLACLYHGWLNGNWLVDHVSIMLPSAVGMCAVFSGLLLFTAAGARQSGTGYGRTLSWTGGLLSLVAGFAMRFSGYEASEFGETAVLASAGLRLPVVSIFMIIASVYLVLRWRRRGLTGGGGRGAPALPAVVSSLLLVAGLVTVPYGHIAIADYSGSAGKLTQEGAARVIEGLLENTYRAVNLKGESEIYDRLALSVDGGLVEEIYLESRRRTVIPSESAAEAKVIDVSVIDVEDGVPAPGGRGYSFTCRWLVSGTVRHWAHKHNRLNRYAGRITIRPVEGVWKISALELIDEVRL